MDFNDTPQETEYREKVRAWLEENTKGHIITAETSRRANNLDEYIGRAKAWQATKAEGGYACMRWPVEYGGAGASAIESVIYNQEQGKFTLPGGVFEIGLGMAGPTMIAYASEEQKRDLLPKMRSGEHVWCQLFSEPSAGSDLAGLRSRVERDGDDWILNGTKIWTTGAHFCDYGILVARHDPNVPKHMGLTYFFIDMKSPGLTIEPIKQASGDSHFCEVFFENVRIPDAQRLGGIGDGWGVALTTLMNERMAVGNAPAPDFNDLLDLAKNTELEDGPAIKNAAVRAKLADWYVQSQGLRLTGFRSLTALSRGQTPGPEQSITKVVSASKYQDIGSFGMDLQDMGGILTSGQEVAYGGVFQGAYIGSPGLRIAGGSDEILRNIIAERVLGMPKDIRVDKELPFSQLPTGTA